MTKQIVSVTDKRDRVSEDHETHQEIIGSTQSSFKPI